MTTTDEAHRLLLEVLDRAVADRSVDAVAEYFDPGFEIHCNGTVYDLTSFRGRLDTALAGNLGYAVDYDDRAWVADTGRVAARVWVASAPASEDASDSELLLIATVTDGRFDHAWVIAWPDRPELRHPLRP